MDPKNRKELGTFAGWPVWQEADGSITTIVASSSQAGEGVSEWNCKDTRELNTRFANWLTRRGVEVERY